MRAGPLALLRARRPFARLSPRTRDVPENRGTSRSNALFRTSLTQMSAATGTGLREVDWVKLLTEFDGHPKVLSVGLPGAGLYARSLAYIGKYETDGAIPEAWVEQAVAREGLHELPGQLVEVGLWTKVESGYEIRDFTEVNRSKKQMDSIRESRSVAGKKGGKQSVKQRESKSPSYSKANSDSFSLEFEDWLSHYRLTTGRSSVRGSKPARDAFAARRKEGWTLEELKQATTGCHADPWRVEHGHDVPDTILRASKVEGYIQAATQPKVARTSPGMANAHRLAEKAAKLEREEAIR
jgi:hypothetical protein